MPPISTHEADRQRIMWNDLIRDDVGRPLGAAGYMQWPGWERCAATILDWKNFKSLPDDQREAFTEHLRGSHRRIAQIDTPIPNHWISGTF